MTADVLDFVHDLRAEDVPAATLHAARRCLLDTVATAAAGTLTPTGRLLHRHAATLYPAGADGARLPFDGRRASPAACAMAGAGAIDSFDAHDGHRLCKGHVGAAVLPATLAFADEIAPAPTLGEFLSRLLVGYEVATRAGIALHRLAAEYHTSGAWNAVGSAALGVRALGLDRQSGGAALGAAEFYAPRGLMMRVIDRPSMLKDGSQMGAFAGVAATLLARDGFRASGAELVESADVADLWADLGQRWRVQEQYFKPYPVCRWAQPALEAAGRLHGDVEVDRIARVRVASFTEAVRLAGAAPRDDDEAQYAIAFPVAALLHHGRLGAEELTGAALRDPATLDLATRIELVAEPRFDSRFPAERWCEVTIETTDGRTLSSGETTTRGDPESPLSDAEVMEKMHDLAGPLLSQARIGRIVQLALHEALDSPGPAVVDELLAPATDARTRASAAGG